jgi:hypothetical protein
MGPSWAVAPYHAKLIVELPVAKKNKIVELPSSSRKNTVLGLRFDLNHLKFSVNIYDCK